MILFSSIKIILFPLFYFYPEFDFNLSVYLLCSIHTYFNYLSFKIMRVEKIKTRRGKNYLEDRAPKLLENDKTTLVMRGNKMSEAVGNALHELYSLKKPLATKLMRLLLSIFINISIIKGKDMFIHLMMIRYYATFLENLTVLFLFLDQVRFVIFANF
jgi:hypothetical protein